MPPVEFEPTVSAGERPQIYAFERAVTETGLNSVHRPTNFGELIFYEQKYFLCPSKKK